MSKNISDERSTAVSLWILNLLSAYGDLANLTVKLHQSEADTIDIPGYFSQLHYCGWSLGSECDSPCPASHVLCCCRPCQWHVSVQYVQLPSLMLPSMTSIHVNTSSINQAIVVAVTAIAIHHHHYQHTYIVFKLWLASVVSLQMTCHSCLLTKPDIQIFNATSVPQFTSKMFHGKYFHDATRDLCSWKMTSVFQWASCWFWQLCSGSALIIPLHLSSSFVHSCTANDSSK